MNELNKLQVLQGVVSCLVLTLMVYLLVRTPRNMALRAVTITIASFALMFVFRQALSDGSGFLGLDPIMARLVQHFTMLLGGYSLIAFFLFSALDIRDARRRARWHAIPVAAAALIMTIATALMPADIRDVTAMLTQGRADGPLSEPTVALLYLTVYLYMVYAFGTALLWTRRCAMGAEPRLRRGLALASVGMAAIVPAELVFAIAAVVRWAGGDMSRPVLLSAIPLFLAGNVIFLVGIAYPAAVMRLAALRVWWQHRGVYHRLAPLWTVLHQEFPEDALSRVPTSPWRDALSLRGVHRRYYRRVIECRDGLVRISPYLGAPGERAETANLAERLREGLRAHASGMSVVARATAVAIPSDDGLDADVHELVALSAALQTSSR